MPVKKHFENKFRLIFTIAISLLNIIFYKKTKLINPQFDYDYWYFFYIWIFCLILGIKIAWDEINKKNKLKVKKILRDDWKYLFLIFLTAIFFYFSYLSSLDFVFVGDSLREAGFNALAVFQQKNFDPFALGSYSGYGNLVPVIGAFFINLFNTNSLAIRLPTVLIAILTIFFLYIYLRLWQNKKTAVFSSLLLIFSLRYLHYARSEIVILSPGLFIIIFLLISYLIQKNKKGWFSLGLMTGLSFHFYVATRPIALIIILYLFLTHFIENKFRFKKIFDNSLNYLLAFLIGIGPAINQLSLKATGAGSWIFQKNNFIELNFLQKVKYIIEQYTAALANNFVSKTSPMHYPQTTPILEFPLNILSLIGIFILLKQKNKKYLNRLILLLLFSLPLFLQVFSSDYSQDQRNIANLILGTIVGGITLTKLFNSQYFIKTKRVKTAHILVYFIIVFNFLSTSKAYFFDKISYKNFIDDQKSFSLQAISNHINHNKKGYLDNNYKIEVIYDHPELLHIQEKLIYYAYPLQIKLIDNEDYQYNYENANLITYSVSKYNFNLSNFNELITQCQQSMFPNYSCPLDNSDYSFFISNNN